jgi:hypothetical protein
MLNEYRQLCLFTFFLAANLRQRAWRFANPEKQRIEAATSGQEEHLITGIL